MSENEDKETETEVEWAEPDPNGANSEAAPDIDPRDGDVDGGGEAEEGAEVDPMAQLSAEVDKWKNLALRNQADLENFRKRSVRDNQDAVRYANSRLLESLLPILDNFEMGLEAARAESEESMIFQGMQMVMNQMRGFLEELGVTEVEAEGKEFDPKLHEAVAQEQNAEVAEGGIVRVTRRGYRLRDRLLRPAGVVVSKGAESGDEGE